jgi:hypothetical protein
MEASSVWIAAAAHAVADPKKTKHTRAAIVVLLNFFAWEKSRLACPVRAAASALLSEGTNAPPNK